MMWALGSFEMSSWRSCEQGDQVSFFLESKCGFVISIEAAGPYALFVEVFVRYYCY